MAKSHQCYEGASYLFPQELISPRWEEWTTYNLKMYGVRSVEKSAYI